MNNFSTRLEQVLQFIKEDLQDFGIDQYWLADQVENCILDYPPTSANLYRIARDISEILLLKLNSYAQTTG